MPKTTDKLIVLDIPVVDPANFQKDFQTAITDLLMLVFERRSLELEEQELYSLNLLCRCMKSIKVVKVRRHLPP